MKLRSDEPLPLDSMVALIMSRLKSPVSFSFLFFTSSFRRRGAMYAAVLSAAIASGCASSDLPDLKELSLREHEARDRIGKKFEAYVKTARLRSTLPSCPAGGGQSMEELLWCPGDGER